MKNHVCLECGDNVQYMHDSAPLVRKNYLSEFRTELEKAKVRKNLGINNDVVLQWGNIKGRIEDLQDLLDFLNAVPYSNDTLPQNVNKISDVLDYLISQDSEGKTQLEELNSELSSLKSLLNGDVLSNIEKINLSITNINSLIDFDENILKWINEHAGSSIIYNEDKLNVKLSEDDSNAIESHEDGLYVKKLLYDSELPDDLKVEYSNSIKVSDLKGKDMNQIIETIFFPTVIPSLVEPSLSITLPNRVVAVNSEVIAPTITYKQNNGGDLVGEIEIEPKEVNYNTPTTITYTAKATYEDGPAAVDNKGVSHPDVFIKGGTKTAQVSIQIVEPWFYGNSSYMNLSIQFGTSVNIKLSGLAIIKIPKSNNLSSFTVEAMGSFIPVDLAGWTITEDGVYKIYTKNDSYSSTLNHKIIVV